MDSPGVRRRAGRGRLNADTTTNVSREIRGSWLATGEDCPRALGQLTGPARRDPGAEEGKGRRAGRRCLAQRHRYRGLMADFIRHLIAARPAAGFRRPCPTAPVGLLREDRGAAERLRISGNLRSAGGGLRGVRRLPGAAWPEGAERAGDFVENELVVIRDATLSEVRDQQASEVFLAALGALVRSGQVRVDGYYPGYVISKGLDHKPVVGREVGKMASVEIATKIAIAAVQDLLARQRRPPLAVTEKTLIMQLAGDGKLLDKDDRPIDPKAGGDRTWSAKVAGETRHVFRISAHELVGATRRILRNSRRSPTSPRTEPVREWSPPCPRRKGPRL